MKRKFTRRRGDRWCSVEIELSEDGRLSITGEEGHVVTRLQARKEAIAYWRSYFEDHPAEIILMNKRHNKRLTSATGAAKFVLETDDEFHGLDVVTDSGVAHKNEVLVLESCGQIQETIREYFPEIAPLLPWHLNDMRADCEHQEALGWLRAAQLENALQDQIRAVSHNREALRAAWKRIKPESAIITIFDMALYAPENRLFHGKERREFETALRRVIARDMDLESELAKPRISYGAPCPTCGYKLGSAWLKRELPESVKRYLLKLAVTDGDDVPLFE